jgi:MFS family permease
MQTSFPQVLAATRLHFPQGSMGIPEATENHLRNFLMSTQALGAVAAIAVNTHVDLVRMIIEEVTGGFDAHVLHVPCWGAFVPALNSLLSFAQRHGMKYILYQSLEVQCTAKVLQRILDHHTKDTLVVGPALDGHTFQSGEVALDGRTVPWNTLAVWSVRKLALTGFLSIAEGLSAAGKHDEENADSPRKRNSQSLIGLMGSDAWWADDTQSAVGGCQSGDSQAITEVPAGVEEVTAVAVLQHLLGADTARAVLLQLPPALTRDVSWSTNWGKDEARKKWHEYKMASRVSRPAAQLSELFQQRRGSKPLNDIKKDDGSSAGKGTQPEDQPKEAASQHFGTVMHFSDSIRPPAQVERITLASFLLFYMNLAGILASVFHHINSSMSKLDVGFSGLLIGGPFLLMPVSLWLTRTLTRRANHKAGLALFAGCLFISHVIIVVAQLFGSAQHWRKLLLFARLFQGLGSGVLFPGGFVLDSLSTSVQHRDLQAWGYLVGDLGFGLGAMLPAAISVLRGSGDLDTDAPDLHTSFVLAMLSFVYLVWVAACFPKYLHILPYRVRFPNLHEIVNSVKDSCEGGVTEDIYRNAICSIATTRVFLQSAILVSAALAMREAHLTGNYRQTLAVAALCLLPMPFEAVTSRLCGNCQHRSQSESKKEKGKMVGGAIGVAVLTWFGIWSGASEEGELLMVLKTFLELVGLMIALAVTAPVNDSQLNKLREAEKTLVGLEWSKAYLGRLLGPPFAIIVFKYVGYQPLLRLLYVLTAVVTISVFKLRN